ncbi:MAG: hypothetical protein FWJ65_06730 [Limnochordales bacterium]
MGYFVWAVLIAAVLGLAYGLWQQSKKNAAAQAAAREAGATDGVECKHVAGLGLANGADCQVWSFPDRLEIREKESGQTFRLALAKLRAIEAKSEREIREVQRSVVGRAVIGHLLVPGIGAIVGGMSGLNTKKKGPLHHYLIVNYVDDHGELQGITFMGDGNILRFQQFAAGVKKLKAQMPRETVTL